MVPQKPVKGVQAVACIRKNIGREPIAVVAPALTRVAVVVQRVVVEATAIIVARAQTSRRKATLLLDLMRRCPSGNALSHAAI